MSELSLLTAVSGRRWIGKYGRLAHSLFQVSSRKKVSEVSSKLLCPVKVATRTIPRHFTWWNSPKVLNSPRIRERNYVSVIPLGGVHVSTRGASTVQKHDTLPTRSDERDVFCAKEHKKDHAAQASICLQQLLGITAEEANTSVEKNQGFSITDPADIPHNYKACIDAGFSEIAIRQDPKILSHPHEILKVKIQLITGMDIDPIDDAIPFLKLGVSALTTFSEKLKWEAKKNEGIHRVTYLTDELQCAKLAVCRIFAKHHFMRNVEFSKLKQVLKIMLDNHIDKEDILSDAWAFRYSPTIITERLERVTDAGVYPVKPWMIRCQELALLKRISKALGQRSVLGDKGTIVEYLSQRFKCDQEKINAFIDKHPEVSQVSGPKIKRVVDLLLENGYTWDHVIRSPRVVFRRIETIQQRLMELRQYGYKPKTLAVFCKSERQYIDFLTSFKLRWLLAKTK